MRPDILDETLAEKFGDKVTPLETPFEIPQFRVEPDVLLDVADLPQGGGLRDAPRRRGRRLLPAFAPF